MKQDSFYSRNYCCNHCIFTLFLFKNDFKMSKTVGTYNKSITIRQFSNFPLYYFHYSIFRAISFSNFKLININLNNLPVQSSILLYPYQLNLNIFLLFPTPPQHNNLQHHKQVFALISIVDNNHMGIGLIFQIHLAETANKFWERLPKMPSLGALNFTPQNINGSFYSFAIAAGVYTVAQTSYCLAKWALKAKPKVPERKQLHDKYGHFAWALIGDCKGNEEYCRFLARNGFSLILLGKAEDISRAKDAALSVNNEVEIHSIVVDWTVSDSDLEFYKHLEENLKHFDIAFLVLPKLERENGDVPSHLQNVQPFQNVYLLVRYFGLHLKFRSYKSAIIFPSMPLEQADKLYNGLSEGLIAGSDGFGRIINYELRESMEVVVARGSVENAFAGLGKVPITF